MPKNYIILVATNYISKNLIILFSTTIHCLVVYVYKMPDVYRKI